MKTKIILASLSVFLYPLPSLPAAQAETLPSVIISEIQITGGTGHANDDFVELYNPNSTSIDISGYRLRYKNSSGTEGSVNKIPSDSCIAAEGYYLWANKDGAFAGIADTKTGTGLSAKYSLALLSPENSENPLIDSVSWENSYPFDTSAFAFLSSPKANESMLRNIATGNWLPDFSLTPTPTKSTETSCPAPTPTPSPEPAPPAPTPTPTTKTVRINEIFPNPKAKNDAGEFIELYNFGAAPADISGWILRDATKTGKYIFPAGTLLAEAGYLAVTDQSFKLSLNNSNETLSLFDNTDALIDSVRYEKTKEDVSLNYTAAGWRGGAPTPGSVNILNNLPETKEKVPKKGYRGIAVDFDARGKDSDRDTLKYTWNFGDGHKSYKEKTSHAYAENGTYPVVLTTNDGKDDLIETFAINIESFPHPEVRITSLMPNPEGNDTDHEWIIIENREKKTVNLKGYGIATGWKALSNHPIRENFLIEAKKEAKVTREHSLFTLPNEKGKIELRAPDGKVLQKIKYKLEKSVAENVVYRKKKGEKWKFEESAAKNMPALDTPTEADDEANGESLVLGVSDTKQEDIPEPEAENTQNETRRTAENRQGGLSLDPDRPLPQDILTYGTHVEVPDIITLTPPSTEKMTVLPKTDSISLSLAERLASNINATLNELFNGSQK